MIHIGSESWFAVQVVPHHELKVAAMLQYKGYQQFVPTYLSRRRWSDRVKEIQRPLFSGYVFCRVCDSSFGLVGTTPGVVRIIGSNGRPLPVSDEEMDAVQKIAQAQVAACPCALHPKIGQRVQVTTGPLAGIKGTLVRIKNHNQLVISVDVVMKAILIDADAFEVHPVSAGDGGTLNCRP